MFDYFVGILEDLPGGVLQNLLAGMVIPIGVFIWGMITQVRKKNVIDTIFTRFREDNNKKAFSKLINAYTKPFFDPISVNSVKEQKEMKFKEFWKYITDDNATDILIVYAEAGMGKSRLSQYLTYKLLLRSKKKDAHEKSIKTIEYIHANGVFFTEFNKYSDVDKLITDITTITKDRPINYLILDGLDEFCGFYNKDNRKDAEETVLKKILIEITKFHLAVQKIIITSRVDMIENAEYAFKNQTYITITGENRRITHFPLSIIKIRRFSNEQIIHRCKTLKKILNKKIDIKKLREHLNEEEDSIFSIAFFTKYIDIFFNKNTNINVNELSYEKALTKIANDNIEKEYNIYKKICDDLKLNEIDIKEYNETMEMFLCNVSYHLLNKNEKYLSKEEIQFIKCEYYNEDTRLFIINQFDGEKSQYKFQHNLFYEYFITLYTLKQNSELSLNECKKILGFDEEINEFNDTLNKKLYIHLLSGRNEIEKINENANTYDFLHTNILEIKDNPELQINEIIKLFPFVQVVFYRNFRIIHYDDIEKYVDEKIFKINTEAIADCEGAEKLGSLKLLDATAGKIDIAQFKYFNTAEIIRTIITQQKDIENLMNSITCVNYELLIETEPSELPKIVQTIIDINLAEPKLSLYKTISSKTYKKALNNRNDSFDDFTFLEGLHFIELHYSNLMDEYTYDIWVDINSIFKKDRKKFYENTKSIYKNRADRYGTNHSYTASILLWYAHSHNYINTDEINSAINNINTDGFSEKLTLFILIKRAECLYSSEKYENVLKIREFICEQLVKYPNAIEYLITAQLDIVSIKIALKEYSEAFALCNYALDNYEDFQLHNLYNRALYYKGLVHSRDGHLEEAVKYYEKAATKGYDWAQNKLGTCYYNGTGIDKNYDMAIEWFEKAAAQNHLTAQYNLGNCYYYGKGDYTKAVEWYEKAAAQGLLSAQNKLGTCYYHGTGVEQNYDMAIEWYEKAAAQNYLRSQCNLGDCYYYGKNDYTKAVEWYEKAATKGYYQAQNKLGNCYYNGTGVEQNYDMAIVWYEKAAAQGHTKAKDMLDKIKNK